MQILSCKTSIPSSLGKLALFPFFTSWYKLLTLPVKITNTIPCQHKLYTIKTLLAFDFRARCLKNTHWDRYVGASYKIGFFTFGLHSGMEYIHLIPFSRVLKKMFQKLTLRNFSSWLNLVNLL